MKEQKSTQPNWLLAGIVTTLLGGIVQVIVNHFDVIVAFLGHSFAHVKIPSGVDRLVVDSFIEWVILAGSTVTAVSYAVQAYQKKEKQLMQWLEPVGREEEK